MSEKMKEYINAQPQVWREIMHSVQSVAGAAAAQMGKVKNLVIIGTGSSLYSARCAVQLLQGEGGIHFFAVEPTRIAPFDEMLEDCVFWAVSQSGKSTSTKAAVNSLCKRGASVFCFTADTNEQINSGADAYIHIPCGEETVPAKTKGMTAICLGLYLMGKALAHGQNAQAGRVDYAALETAFDYFGENISRAGVFAAKHIQTLKSAKAISVLAGTSALPIAQEAALKLTETLYIPVCAYELEEYLHGVYNIIEPGALHILLIESELSAPRFDALFAFCKEKGCECLIIDGSMRKTEGEHSLELLCTGQDSTFIYEALPVFQLMCALVSEAKGIECDVPRYPEFYARLATKEGAV